MSTVHPVHYTRRKPTWAGSRGFPGDWVKNNGGASPIFIGPCTPDFLSKFVRSATFMRLSLMKAEHAAVGEGGEAGNPVRRCEPGAPVPALTRFVPVREPRSTTISLKLGRGAPHSPQRTWAFHDVFRLLSLPLSLLLDVVAYRLSSAFKSKLRISRCKYFG